LWTAEQAARLGATPEALLAAVSRGWTPDAIERVKEAAELIGAPRRG